MNPQMRSQTTSRLHSTFGRPAAAWAAAWIALAVLSALPAAAGEETKCDMSTSECIREMVSYVKDRGWIGIEINSEGDGPARITKVVAGSPAEGAGFRTGDLFLALNGVRYTEMENDAEKMRRTKKAIQPGNRVRFTLGRDGGEIELVVEPIEIPRHILAQWVGQHILEQHLEPEVAEGEPEGTAAGGAEPGASPRP